VHVPATLALFASLLILLVVLRLRWPRLSNQLQRLMIVAACAALAIQGLISVSGWTLNNSLLRVTIYWAAMVAYEFFILLFTFLRPRWLTTMIAIVLILPLLSASIFLPLAALFDHSEHHAQLLGDTIWSETTPWNSVLGSISGTDVDIFERNSHIPFLRKSLGGVRFYSSQCDIAGLKIKLQPDRRSIYFHCPNRSGDGGNNSQLHLPRR
jgi:hypothetical protein